MKMITRASATRTIECQPDPQLMHLTTSNFYYCTKHSISTRSFKRYSSGNRSYIRPIHFCFSFDNSRLT